MISNYIYSMLILSLFVLYKINLKAIQSMKQEIRIETTSYYRLIYYA